MTEKRQLQRPIMGGTNRGIRPVRYDYWRVGYGSPESFALDFWIERAGEFHCKPNYVTTHFDHPSSTQFYFHLDGSAAVTANGIKTAVSPGDVLATPFGQPFRYAGKRSMKYHWFAIPNRWPSILGRPQLQWLAHGYDAELETRFVEIREILILQKPGYALRVVGVFYELIARVMERKHTSVASSTYPEAVRNALTYLRENVTSPYNATATATAVGLSQSHLRALFEKWVGESPRQYHTRCRIEAAKRLLSQENLSVAQIAMQVGFHDARYFSRVFKRVTGVTPSQYATR
jgi:AraC-like DNA-binding protein